MIILAVVEKLGEKDDTAAVCHSSSASSRETYGGNLLHTKLQNPVVCFFFLCMSGQ